MVWAWFALFPITVPLSMLCCQGSSYLWGLVHFPYKCFLGLRSPGQCCVFLGMVFLRWCHNIWHWLRQSIYHAVYDQIWFLHSFYNWLWNDCLCMPIVRQLVFLGQMSLCLWLAWIWGISASLCFHCLTGSGISCHWFPSILTGYGCPLTTSLVVSEVCSNGGVSAWLPCLRWLKFVPPWSSWLHPLPVQF